MKRTYSHRLSDYALEFYSFIMGNYAPFYTTPIECAERDAAYVLDGLLYHEADIEPEEHRCRHARLYKEIQRMIGEAAEEELAPLRFELLSHVSPIGWENVMLYGQYVLHRELARV